MDGRSNWDEPHPSSPELGGFEPVGGDPFPAARGKGARLWGVDGNEFVLSEATPLARRPDTAGAAPGGES